MASLRRGEWLVKRGHIGDEGLIVKQLLTVNFDGRLEGANRQNGSGPGIQVDATIQTRIAGSRMSD